MLHGPDGHRSAIDVEKTPIASPPKIAGDVDHQVICCKSCIDCRGSPRDWLQRIQSDCSKLTNCLAEQGLITNTVHVDQPLSVFVANTIVSRCVLKWVCIRHLSQSLRVGLTRDHDHPFDVKLVRQHTKTRRPECLHQRHHDAAAHRECIKRLMRFCLIGDRESELKALKI